MLNKKIEEYIRRRGFLNRDHSYLVALSGGADSVALLLMLRQLGYSIEAAHCNFHLRGDESVRDEHFCQNLCIQLGIKLHIAHFDTIAYAQLHKVSIEMAARDLRYNYFRQLLADCHLNGICVAHHKNDSVETVLLNLVRGTGIEGLKGIVPISGDVIRPLLCVTRNEIETYLQSIKQDYVTDSTNFEDDVQRNKVRLNLMPILRTLNPAADENISKSAERVEATLRILQRAVGEAVERVSTHNGDTLEISIPKLLNEVSPEIILWEILKRHGFTSAQVEQIHSHLHAQSGKEWHSAISSLAFHRHNILVEPLKCAPLGAMKLPETGTYRYAGSKITVVTHIADASFTPSREAFRITLDAANIDFPLTIRPAAQADSFVPFGMKGRKLLSDFLTDRKLSVLAKRRQLVVTDAKGDILWVVGLRTDNRHRISNTTHTVLEIAITNNP